MIDSRRKPIIQVQFLFDGYVVSRRYPVPNRENAMKWAERKLEFEFPAAYAALVIEWVFDRQRNKIPASRVIFYAEEGIWRKSA